MMGAGLPSAVQDIAVPLELENWTRFGGSCIKLGARVWYSELAPMIKKKK